MKRNRTPTKTAALGFLAIIAAEFLTAADASATLARFPCRRILDASLIGLGGTRIGLKMRSRNAVLGAALSTLNPLASSIIGIPAANQLLQEAEEIRLAQETNPYSALAQAMNLTIPVVAEKEAKIPKTGSLVVVANHPLSGVDGIALGAVLSKTRPDVKVLMRAELGQSSLLRDSAFFLPLGSTFNREWVEVLRQMKEWLQAGHAIVAFPSGEVFPPEIEAAWNGMIFDLILETNSSVLPAFVNGNPSSTFQRLKGWGEGFARGYFVREILGQKNSTVPISFGSVFLPPTINKISRSAGTGIRPKKFLADFFQTLTLANQVDATESVPTDSRPQAELAPPVDSAQLSAEVHGLIKKAGGHLLIEDDGIQILSARSYEIPLMMRQIARERERTFRIEGEGSGKAEDRDAFDETYHQLFAWDAQNSRFVGAYRMGVATEILPVAGAKGFYSRSLFGYDPTTQTEFQTAVELGRSFVIPEYQKGSPAFNLLLKGIGRFVARNPNITSLFGPTSISGTFRDISKYVLIEYLKKRLSLLPTQGEVTGNPVHLELKPIEARAAELALNFAGSLSEAQGLRELSALVASLEPNGRPLPVLFEKYVMLGGKFMAFNPDPDFNSVDGLVMVDLRQIPFSVLKHFMSRDEAAAYLRHHGRPVPAQQP